MPSVSVIILHAEPAPKAGPLERTFVETRRRLAETHAEAFRKLGADDVRIVAGPPDEIPFGRRVAGLLAHPGAWRAKEGGGLIVLGSGSIPLARKRELRAFAIAAGDGERRALANNLYSADVVAISRVDELPPLPDLPADNALPRWLAEVAGWEVEDLRARWRLQVDFDSPLDVILAGMSPSGAGVADFGIGELGVGDLDVLRDRIEAVRGVFADRRSEVLVAGRTSATTLRWLERRTSSRTRTLVEERGLRAASPLAQASAVARSTGDAIQAARPPRSVLGLVLDTRGPEAFGSTLAELGDAAVIDTRVLLAHRLGADERAWPAAEDRFASDLLLPERIADPWLRALTASAVEAPIPVLLGGHTLVGPGIRLVARRQAG